jgi:hypothetical protein
MLFLKYSFKYKIKKLLNYKKQKQKLNINSL